MYGNQNSRIEINLGVIRHLLEDIAILTSQLGLLRDLSASTISMHLRRDFEYIRHRTHHEGEQFLTITLPLLGKWYDQVLAQRDIPCPAGFKPLVEQTYPRFLQLYWRIIHDDSNDTMTRARVIRAFRTLLFLFYKLETPLSQSQISEALEKWYQTEEDLEFQDLPSWFDEYSIEIRGYISRLLYGLEEDVRKPYTSSRHGPGAVAGREKGDQKWESWSRLLPLSEVYPRYDYLLTSLRVDPISVPSVRSLLSRETKIATSRLLFVPKDSRGPRTISCEPKELMFVQQGVMDILMKVVPKRTGGCVQFMSQEANQKAALQGCNSDLVATIDMKDASDRISVKLVDHLFPSWVQKYLMALRSPLTELPNGEIVSLQKYAPMGSALCFPIESIVFWSLAICSTRRALNITSRAAEAYVRIFGDDIIIHPLAFPLFERLCNRYSLIVNKEKSFTHGPFRESCGVDAWHGHVITPLRIRKDLCPRSPNGTLAVAVAEYATAFFSVDYRETGGFLYNLVDSWYPGVYRYYLPSCGCLGVVDPLAFEKPRLRWNSRLCRLEYRGWIVIQPKRDSTLDGLPRLLKNLYGSWSEHSPMTVAVPRAAKIRKRNTWWKEWDRGAHSPV